MALLFYSVSYVELVHIVFSFLSESKLEVEAGVYTEDFSQGVMVSCNGFFFNVVKCRQITSTVINYHVGWTISRYVT